MHFTLQLLILGSSILRATYAGDKRSSQSIKCVDLNFQAAALQSDDSCALLNSVINGVDILGVDMIDIDATCGFHLEDVDHPMCVDDVVDVVAGLTGEECLVTGGASVVDFISTVNVNKEGFSTLTRLACTRIGECYADIQNAVRYCNENPSDEGCIDYARCDCVMDFLSIIEALPEDFVNLDGVIIDKVENTGTTCRCEDLYSRSLTLELGPSCALSTEILKAGDILAGDDSTLADTCNDNAVVETTSCVDGIVEVGGWFIKYGCAVTYDNADFIYTLHDSSEDFKTITDFACNNDCYPAIKKCQNDTTCTDSLSCECTSVFLSIVDGLSPHSKEDFLSRYDSTINDMQRAVVKCNCDELNANAALFQDEGYCSLHNSIVKRRSIFAGDSSDFESTCTERSSCVGKVTDIVAQINDEGCEIKQDTDYGAKFIYYVNNNTDWNEMTHFICNSHEGLLKPDEGCYDEIKDVAESCAGDAADNCTESARSVCLDGFMDMVERLSDDSLLGIDSVVLNRMKTGKGIEYADTNGTTSTANQTQPDTAQPSLFEDISRFAMLLGLSIIISCLLALLLLMRKRSR